MKVIIVEDERVTREGLARLLGQMEDVTVCATCKNAREGFEQIVRLRPDGVITDIVMEGESGLDMIERCRARGVRCAFVLLSGYSEFEYARRALKLQVFDYLNKPLDFAAMEAVVDRLKAWVSEGRDLADRSVELLSGAPGGVEPAPSELLRSKALYVVAAVFYGRDGEEGGSEFGRQCCEQAARRRMKDYGHYMERRGFHCQLVTSEEDRELYCQELLRRCGQAGLGARVGVSQRFDGIGRISPAIDQAVAAAQACAVENKPMLQADLLPYQVSERPEGMFAREYACIRDDLYQTDADRICAAVFAALEGMRLALPPYVIFAFLRRCARELCWSAGEDRDEGRWEAVAGRIDSAPDMRRLRQRFEAIVREQLSLLKRRADYKSEDSLGKAIGYININYMRAIRSADVARRFGMEPTYFSKQFKKRTGRNYNDYVTRLRMKRAERLLSLGSYTVAEVAELVGYQSQRHFSLLFRQYAGLYPSEVQRAPKA